MLHYRLQTLLLLLVLFAAEFSRTDAGSHGSRDLQVLYDSEVNLTCADDYFYPDLVLNATFQWLLPNGHLVPSSSVSNMSNHYTVLNNGTSLIISDVDRPDFGLYLCLVSIDGVIKASVRWTVNKDGPYYGDLWAKYWPQAKIGLLSGAAVFIFLSMLCINLDQFQNHYDQNEAERRRVHLRPYLSDQEMTNPGYTNAAFSPMPSSFDSAGMFGVDATQTDDRNHDAAHTGESESKTSL